RGALVERVLVAGTAEQVDELDAVFTREPWLGYRTVGALTTETTTEPTEPTTGPATGPATGPTTAGAAGPRTPGGTPVVGCVEDARRVAADLGVDAMVLASGAVRSAVQMRHLLWE
ncbi:nucleoside-diphosphate sugar epimerase/dehydratase, partial [Klebsiella pneumoniae]|uniref:nucleoside-diphosphate sugar epimerase/dehydratase n=1 Tax=Klebsiella pneumoniae TaxID=573 RepID=UPI003F25EBC0